MTSKKAFKVDGLLVHPVQILHVPDVVPLPGGPLLDHLASTATTAILRSSIVLVAFANQFRMAPTRVFCN